MEAKGVFSTGLGLPNGSSSTGMAQCCLSSFADTTTLCEHVQAADGPVLLILTNTTYRPMTTYFPETTNQRMTPRPSTNRFNKSPIEQFAFCNRLYRTSPKPLTPGTAFRNAIWVTFYASSHLPGGRARSSIPSRRTFLTSGCSVRKWKTKSVLWKALSERSVDSQFSPIIGQKDTYRSTDFTTLTTR